MERTNIQKENGTTLTRKNYLTVPVAIVIAGALIGGAVYVSMSSRGGNVAELPSPPVGAGNASGLERMRPISESDHIRGDPNAPVKIVEYSDMECPFCKRFHPTMQRVVEEYDGKVAWVYRHFPLDAIHSKARSEARAAECAGELGGPDAFWRYVDRFFELTPSNNQTDTQTILPQIAGEIGLEVNQFSTCLASGKYNDRIQDDLDNAMATGGNGTPWSIIVTAGGKKYPLSGAQPYEVVKQLIELALQEK